MKAAKIWQALLDGSRNVRFDDLVRLAEAFGFELKRIAGSHHIPVHPAMAELLNLQPGPDGKATPYQIKQLVTLVERRGLKLRG
jgi:predicted RNA binding protein YcfA (HicA-like mRNA interferase family)